MKKKFMIGFVCLLILFIAYIGYKTYLLSEYKVSINDDLKEQLDNLNPTINITTNNDYNNNDMMKFENIVYKKLEDNFVYNEDKSSLESLNPYYSYYLDGISTEDFKGIFRVGRTYNIYNSLISGDINTFGFSFKNTNTKKLLNKYNINNDYDIYEYIVKHYNDKVNIFSSRDKIRLNYLIKMYANVAIPNSEINLIDGDFKGYMYTINDGLIYEVHIIHNDTNYAFGFFNGKSNNYFNLEDIKDFLNNLHYKD